MSLCFRVAAEQGERELRNRNLQQQDSERDCEADNHCLPERYAQPVVVPCAVTLGGNTGRSHAQEVHTHVQEREDRPADSDGAEVRRALEVAGNAGVDHAEQGHGDIGQDQRRGNTPDVAVCRHQPKALTPVSSLPTTSWWTVSVPS